jgi:hypothetical protein
MRHRLNKNEEVVREWVARAPIAPAADPSLRLYSRGHRVMSDGHALFSYGKHFILARWFPVQKIFLLNSDRRSNSTSKHQGFVRRHMGSNSLEVGSAITYSPEGNPAVYLDRWSKLIQEATSKASRARSRKNHYLNQLQKLTSDRDLFMRLFTQNTTATPAFTNSPVNCSVALQNSTQP